MSKKKYNVLSPDGFSIHPTDEYDSPEKAWEAVDEWMKRYERQGYYSAVSGQIPLNELKENCTLIKL